MLAIDRMLNSNQVRHWQTSVPYFPQLLDMEPTVRFSPQKAYNKYKQRLAQLVDRPSSATA